MTGWVMTIVGIYLSLFVLTSTYIMAVSRIVPVWWSIFFFPVTFAAFLMIWVLDPLLQEK